MVENRNIDVIKSTDEFFFSENDIFNHNNGLKFAVAFTGYDNVQEWILPPEIGELIF